MLRRRRLRRQPRTRPRLLSRSVIDADACFETPLRIDYQMGGFRDLVQRDELAALAQIGRDAGIGDFVGAACASG